MEFIRLEHSSSQSGFQFEVLTISSDPLVVLPFLKNYCLNERKLQEDYKDSNIKI